MLVDGAIREANSFGDGTAKTMVPVSESGDSYMVYGADADVRVIILANDAPAETCAGSATRRDFETPSNSRLSMSGNRRK